MLISAVLPIMSLYKLPHGKYAYSGHVVNLPQDVASFTNSLPRLPSELDIIIVRKEGASNSHRDFRVRRAAALCALQWLVANKYYRNIHINLEAVATLPEDGDISGLHSVSLNSTEDTGSPQTLDEDDDPYSTNLSGSFVPSTTQRMREQETVRQSVQQWQSHQQQVAPPTVSWPPCGSAPINEFNTEGYMLCAFPTLFPTGAADFLAPRPVGVTIGDYLKYMMMYEDCRFTRHPRFCYFALNIEMCWRALQAGHIYVRQHPHDAQLSVEELRGMVGREGETFSCHVLHYATSLRGTKQYWFKQRSQLIAMVDTLDLPTIFFTHSAADLQWPELACLICPDDPDSSSARSRAVQENLA